MALLVYAVVDIPVLLRAGVDGSGAKAGIEFAGFVLLLIGPVFVQGSLVAIVRNVHEGQRPESIGALLGHAAARIRSLFWASLVYGFGVFFGLLLLVVPGLLAASRWSLMAPLIMLEGDSAGAARARSRELVKPYTWTVLGTLIVTFIATGIVNGIAPAIFRASGAGPVLEYVITVVSSGLTAPFVAHVLTVIYYRITDASRPVISPEVSEWPSVWEGPTPVE